MQLHRYERSDRAEDDGVLKSIAQRLPIIDMVESRQWEMVRTLPRHEHTDLYHLDIFLSGSGAYWIGDTLSPVDTRSFYFIPPNTPHQLRVDDGKNLHHLSIKFKYDLIPQSFLPPALSIEESISAKLQLRLRECAETLFDDPRQTVTASLILASVLTALYHEYHQTKMAGEEHHLVTASKAFMDLHFSERLSLDDIARYAGVGGPHLCRVFKAETGQTPFEYLRWVRLNCAKYWLHQTRERFSQIAEATGFGAAQEMNRAFRKLEGMSPREYRRLVSEGNGTNTHTWR